MVSIITFVVSCVLVSEQKLELFLLGKVVAC